MRCGLGFPHACGDRLCPPGAIASPVRCGPSADRPPHGSALGPALGGESSVQLSPWYEKGEGAEGLFPRFSTDRLARLGIDSPKGLRDRSRL